jgi:fructose-specific component phosphotransferase system IIB-like protein
MKKLVLGMLITVLVLGLSSCGLRGKPAEEKQSTLPGAVVPEVDIRKTVYDQMDQKDRDRMREGWEEAEVTTVILREGMALMSDASYIGKEVFVVDFRVKTMAIPDNMIFYASKPDGRIVGIGLVD